MSRTLTLDAEFSSAHYYKNETMSKSENKKYFGRCFSVYGHGHNYKLEVAFKIPLEANLREILTVKQILSTKITDLANVLDHQHLNFMIPEFKKTVPTTENILLYFETKILKLKLPNQLFHIRLLESENLWSEKYYVTK